MRPPRKRKNSGAKAKPRPSRPSEVLATPTWPFKEGRFIDAWLRAQDPDRTVTDLGNGIRLYPQRSGAMAMVDSVRRTCSKAWCRKQVGECLDLIEDDFRFGPHSLHDYRPPEKYISEPRKKKNGKYSNAKRIRSRPNPMVGEVTAATRKRWGRIELPDGVPRIAAELAHWLRTTDAEGQSRVLSPGRPRIDKYDLAIVAALRAYDNLSFESLIKKTQRWHDEGVLTNAFHFNALSEMYGTQTLIDVLDRMAQRIERIFRLIAKDYVCDGVVFSTASSDNSRTERYSDGGPVQVTLHAMYERRWGLLTGFRVTWDKRGRGSGEPLHFPHIVKMTKRNLNVGNVLGDGAFASEANFKFADEQRFNLYAPITASKWKSSTKKLLGEFRAAQIFKECNKSNPGPTMKQVYGFRNSAEGWHGVHQHETSHFIVARPDRGNYPLTKDEWIKANPESAYEKLPNDFAERERIIATEQNVGGKVVCEFYARRLAMHLHTLVITQEWYQEQVDFFADRAFRPRPEDDFFSMLRDAV